MTSVPKDARVFVAGHAGLVGSAVLRKLKAEGYTTLLVARRDQLDLRDQAAVNYWFRANRPEYVYLVAGTVGGIMANSTRPAEFLYDNMMIHGTVVHASHLYDVTKLLYLGSSCIYPKLAPQPIVEDSLLTGPLEPTNEAYAIAKIAGLKLCQHYRRQYGVLFHSAMPTNLYGPGDNYHPLDSHVLPALIRRFHEAKEARQPEVAAWGTGAPRREFLHVDNLADACAFLFRLPNPPDWINVGTGTDVTIKELTELVATAVGYRGRIVWDPSKPDGTPRKLMDGTRLAALGWRAQIGLREGIEKTYAAFLAEKAAGTLRA